MSEKIGNFFSHLPINENNMRWELYLTGVGLATVQAGDVYPPKGFPACTTSGGNPICMSSAKMKLL